MKRYLLTGTAIVFGLSASLADTYVVINKNAKIFDEPDATGFVTLNSQNEEVTLSPGMVFKSLEKNKGWHIVEYSPGLRGYLSEMVTAPRCLKSEPGEYKVVNNDNLTISVSNENGNWSATAAGVNYSGKEFGNIVVFFNPEGNPAYSLSNIGSGPMVITYDNTITKFF